MHHGVLRQSRVQLQTIPAEPVSLETFFSIDACSCCSMFTVHERQSPEHMNEFSDYLFVSSMSRQTRCTQCGMDISTEQYSDHFERCLAQKEVIPNDSNIGQCPLCNKMVQNLPQHCEMCITDNDDENYEILEATSVPQVYNNVFLVPENLSICIVYFLLSLRVRVVRAGRVSLLSPTLKKSDFD
jgi:hypothetical protein